MNITNLTETQRQLYVSTGKIHYTFLLQDGYPEIPAEFLTEDKFIELGIQAFQALENENVNQGNLS